ncbi:MAG: DUF3025 domain-containing protein, partial [Lysobacteraceae bacterium]
MRAKRRFVAPPRDAVDPVCFDHPVHAGYAAFRAWCVSPDWPSIDALNAALPGDGPRFVAQDAALLDDGLHYETRIAERGAIATRPGNWHDLFNAMVWCRHPALKRALNARQCMHIATMGPSERNRAQYALTQFDEAGAIVRVRDPALLAAWDRHDWRALCFDHAGAWRRGDIAVAAVVGHALLEISLQPALYPVAKCLVVSGDVDDVACVARVAGAIAGGDVLADPLELRPLPLAGIPGWHPVQDAAFYATAP